MDALELALSCSSLYKLTAKSCKDGDLSSSSESSHILQLLQSTALSDQELLQWVMDLHTYTPPQDIQFTRHSCGSVMVQEKFLTCLTFSVDP